MSPANPQGLTDAYWKGGVDVKLDAVLSRVDSLATEKEGSHRVIYERLDRLDARWNRAAGIALGLGIGAGAVGGGVGAIVSTLIGG